MAIRLTVSWYPHSPGSHDGSLEIGLELLGVVVPRLSFNQVQVSKEHASKDGVPDGLINKDLGGNCDGLGSGELAIQKAVKVVSGTSVDKESERSQTDGTHNVIWLATILDKVLRQDISGGESCQRSQALGQKRLCLQQLVVASPKSRHG